MNQRLVTQRFLMEPDALRLFDQESFLACTGEERDAAYQ
jgi:hypothetical protein